MVLVFRESLENRSIAAPILFVNGLVCGFSQNQACTGFQQCVAMKDPSMCLQEMLTALSALAGGAAGGAAGTSPCQTTPPCQGGAVPAPMPQPMPYPQPAPYPAPYPMPYPGDISMQPVSCGGTYPCKDKARKGKKGKKRRDSKEKKHHKSHHKKE